MPSSSPLNLCAMTVRQTDMLGTVQAAAAGDESPWDWAIARAGSAACPSSAVRPPVDWTSPGLGCHPRLCRWRRTRSGDWPSRARAR